MSLQTRAAGHRLSSLWQTPILTAVALQAWTRVNTTVYSCVQKLCEDPSTTVIIFSGADKGKLEETFGELDIWLAAENGMFMRPALSSSSASKVGAACVWQHASPGSYLAL